MSKSENRTKYASGTDPGTGRPGFVLENRFNERGWAVCGVDEAGRGPLAGPVVAAAVILDRDNIPDGIHDSKKLPAGKRCALYDQIMETAFVGIASASPRTIAERNIRGATLHAMSQAVNALAISPDLALIDGRDIPSTLRCRAMALIKGDNSSLSVAAASIVAKVTRDRMCALLDASLPEYGFARHKGYGTRLHLAALEKYGPTAHHRRDFRPVAELLKRNR